MLLQFQSIYANTISSSIRRLAIKYIRHLQYLLSFPPGQKIPSHIVEFDPSVSAWVKGKNLPGAVSIDELVRKK